MVRDSSSVSEPRLPAGEAPPAAPAGSASHDPNGRRGDRPPRKRRRFLRLLVWALVLLLLLAVVVQLVLWSNLPRRLVLNQLQNQLGLRVQASSLSTGWLGNTNLREVTLGLPMVEQSFLDMPRMKVKHTSIFGLLLMRPVSVDLIELENPTLYVRRDEAGRWNLQQVAELVARAGGSKPADESAKQARPELPEVRVIDATVVVQDYQKAEQKIRPLSVHGRPDPKTPGILWRYDVQVPDHLKLVGQVSPGAPWGHQINLGVVNIDEWMEPWSPGFPEDAKLEAEWSGQTTDQGLAGRLQLKEARAAGNNATGVVHVTTAGGTVTLRPDGLTLKTANATVADVKVASGAVVYDGASLRSDRLFVAVLGGQARVDGEYTLATHSGQLKSEWLDITTGAIRHSGSLDAKVGSTFQNRPQLEATLVSKGVSPDGPWDADVQVNGTSAGGWADMDYTVTAKQLDWKGNYPLDLDGLFARLETRVDDQTKQRVIRLAQLTSPGNAIQSVGEYNLATSKWKFWTSLNALPIPGGGGASGGADVGVAVRKENAAADTAANGPDAKAKQNAASLAVVLNTWGDAEKLEIGQFLVRGAEFEMTANGVYVYDRPTPLEFLFKVRHIPPRIADRDRPPVYGYISGEGSLKGTLFNPRNLRLEGKLLGEGVTAYKRSIGDLNVKVSGTADNNHAVLKSEQLELLKGQWSFDALYTKQSRAVAMNLRVAELDLREVGDLLAPFDPNDTRPVRRTEQETDTLSGRLTGEWNFEVPGTDKDRLRVNGAVKIADLRAPGFVADAVEAKTVLDNGTFTLGPVTLQRAITRTVDGAPKRIEGRADASVSADLDDLTQIVASLNLQNWPLEAGAEGWLDISGGTEKLVIDLASDPDAKQKILPGKSAAGSIHFASALTYKGQSLGKTEILGDFLGRMLDLRKFDIQTLDGNVTGNGVIELEKPLEARAFFSWEKVNSQRLVEIAPALAGLEGIYTGRLRIQPSVDPRAIGPLAISYEMTPENGRYKSLQIGRTTILAYADLNRFVLNDPADLASTIEIGGGLLKLWGRVSYHNLESTKDAISSQVLIDFKDLDLNQIIHAANPEANDTPGRLEGSLTIMGATRGPRLTPRPPGAAPTPFAEKLATAVVVHGPVKLSDAKLGVLPVFSDLYNLMSLGQNVKNNNGVGDAEVRLENGTLSISNLRYFNRGTEIRSPSFTFERIWEMPNSPLTGTAFGSARPFSSLKLPFISEFDRLLGLLTEDLVAIGVRGTVDDPQPYQLGLEGLGRDIKNAIFGDGSTPSGTMPRK